jgi:hypothetical protein
VTGVPDLPAFHHINDIIVVTPKVLKLLFDPAVITGEQRVPHSQPLTTTRIICDMGVNVIQALRIKKVYVC